MSAYVVERTDRGGDFLPALAKSLPTQMAFRRHVSSRPDDTIQRVVNILKATK